MAKIKASFYALIFIVGFMFFMDTGYGTSGQLENEQAEALKTLGLFKGVSETDFDLDRPPTRVER